MVAGAVSVLPISPQICFLFSCTLILPTSTNMSLLGSCSWAARTHFACLKREPNMLGNWHRSGSNLNQRLVRWGINISFLFTLIGTAFRLDLHCLPNSPQDWAKVPLAWGPTGLCLVSPLCLASLPSCHFPIALWFSLGNTPNHFHTDLCFRVCLWGLFDKIPRVLAQHK